MFQHTISQGERIACNTEANAGVATLYARADHITICLGILREYAARTERQLRVASVGNQQSTSQGMVTRANLWLQDHAKRYGLIWTVLGAIIALLLSALALF